MLLLLLAGWGEASGTPPTYAGDPRATCVLARVAVPVLHGRAVFVLERLAVTA